MKHKIFALCMMVSCFLTLTACGSEVNYNSVEGSKYYPDIFTSDTIQSYANYLEEELFEKWYLSGITPENFENSEYFNLAMKVNNQTGELSVDEDYYNVHKSGYESWYNAVEDIGFNSLESLKDDIYVSDVAYFVNDDGELVIDATIQGTDHSALMEVYLGNDFNPTNLGVTVNKTTGEKLTNAGLNTLLGMGMAFAILILISLIISLFPTLFGGKNKKKESDGEIAQKAIENTVTQIADKEDLSNDAELVAVIAAAIAAYEGSASTDGFVVRSIRKVNRNWKNNK